MNDDDASEDNSNNVVPFARKEKTPSPKTVKPAGKQPKPAAKQDVLMPSSDWKTIKSLKAGQILPCRVVRKEDGGYAVKTKREGLPGFMPSNRNLGEGEEVQTMFVRIDQRRLLLTERLTGGGFKTD